ncbi:MAG: NUDIX domain-containing protein [Anaerolineae bacterium]
MQHQAEYTYCPMCAAELVYRSLFGRQRRQCPACGWIHFRDPKVGTGILAERDGQVILVRRGVDPGKGRWCFPSGFVEIDESPRMAAVREFKEETGLDVTITGLLDVYHYNADFRGPGIMVLYRGTVTGGAPTPMDDVVEVGFFGPDTLPETEIAFESNRVALARWQGERTQR